MNKKDATLQEIDRCMHEAYAVSAWFQSCHAFRKRDLLYAISRELNHIGVELIGMAALETRLPEARLRAELARTIKQLNSYGDYAAAGQHLDIRIDTAMADRNPPRTDIRKMNIPLGPVVIFGASNFPFAYSTAGGDTASALAAGCPVVVKAHPAHPSTSLMTANAIKKALSSLDMPDAVFQHLFGASPQVGEALVKHPLTKAVGFTGSYKGGKQLFDWGNQRPEPIPVFAEMGSVNPVYLLPEKLSADTEKIAVMYAESISLGAGQFCTNPGILVALENETTRRFADMLARKLDAIQPAAMLHAGIKQKYEEHRQAALNQKGIKKLTQAELTDEHTRNITDPAIPTLACVSANSFLANPILYQEVFGPFSLLVICEDLHQMEAVAASMPGQLTSSILATEEECHRHKKLLEEIRQHCGRIIFNGVPTGVEVCPAMQHGGPFPASTDSRFTSVGPDAIRRFVRPVSYQNCPDSLLPDALKNANPLKYLRMVNGSWTMEPITA